MLSRASHFHASSAFLLAVLSVLIRPCAPAFCSGLWSVLSSSECPLAPDAIERLGRALEEELAGQTLAARAIEKAVVRNIKRHSNHDSSWTGLLTGLPHSIEQKIDKNSAPSSSARPLMMHFTGPTVRFTSSPFSPAPAHVSRS